MNKLSQKQINYLINALDWYEMHYQTRVYFVMCEDNTVLYFRDSENNGGFTHRYVGHKEPYPLYPQHHSRPK